MNPEPLTCPYCNALIPAGAAAGPRVPCPRCGEAFTLRQTPPAPSPDLQATPTAAAAAPVGEDLGVDRRLRAARNNRLVGGAVLGVMVVMAAIGLAFALYTQPDRRAHDTAMPPPPRRSPLANAPPPEPAPPAATAPAALEALRWLPADCTVVAGVQVAELRQSEAGRNLLNHLFHIGKIQIGADVLERWTGVKTEDVDHLVIGVKAEDAVPPPTVVVVRTLRPYDPTAVKAALQAERDPDAPPGRMLYKGKPLDAGLRPVVWFADERTLMVGLMEKHLEAVPDRPAAGLERLPAEVRELLEQRLSPGGPAWVVGHSADWRRTGAALLFGAAPEKDANVLAYVRDFALQMQAERQATLLASLRCDGDDAAQGLESRLTAAKPADADWNATRDGSWVTVQVRGDPAVLFKGFGK